MLFQSSFTESACIVETEDDRGGCMHGNVPNLNILMPKINNSELAVMTMVTNYPYLDVKEPDGTEYRLEFRDILAQKGESAAVLIGRSNENDIVLPDPHRTVSRSHCVMEREGERWWLRDEGSANGTFVRQQRGGAELDVRSVEMALLQDGDVILILGELTESEQPLFWQLTFRDPNVTQRVEGFQPMAEVEYSLSQRMLFKVTRQQRTEVKLSPQERNLVHYMAQRNLENGNQSAVCGYEELIAAIWEEPFGHVANEVNRLVWSIRAKIERDSGEPFYLRTVRGQGYVLDVRVQ
ncbi:MAG: FHA domain-containing protein [Acaryochloridaceae cyanobacterium RU_4_10]|nr:FHA domain-containing protein [Acaryochloridaceae cyanobacterium RU_4_10]